MRMRTSPTESAGFTLVEVTLVVVIIGVLAAIVFPHLDAVMPKHSLRAAANEVLGIVALARSQARLKQYDVDLTYDIDSGAAFVEAFFLEEDGVLIQTDEPQVQLSRRMPKGVKIKQVHYAETRVAASGTATATFRASGAVGEHMVVLANENGDTASIFVPALTGAAFVVEGDLTYEQIRAPRRL